MFSIQKTPIDVMALRHQMTDPTCGALVVFEGLVRNHHEGRDVEKLHYTRHPVLAQKEGEKIVADNRYLIDSIKARVPIWKQESYATGEVEWTSACPNCGPVPH